MQKMRILLADDHKLFRSGLVEILEADPDIEVIDQAENGEEAVQKYFELKPDIVLMDITMPKLYGTDALREITVKDKNARVLFLTMHDDEVFIYQILKFGGLGILNKNTDKQELLNAVKKVYKGEKFFGKEFNNEILDGIVRRFDLLAGSSNNPIIALTPREKSVLELIAKGYTSGMIAEELNIGKRTIDAHRTNLMQKLELDSLPELIRYAIKYTDMNTKKNIN